MQSKSKSANCVEARTYNVPNSTVFSEPWWNTAGNNPVSLGLMGRSASDPPSAEQAVDGGSQSDDGSNEEDDDAPEISETTIPMHSGSYAQVDQNLQSIASTIPPKGDGSLTQPPQLEPVAHSMACAPNLYVDPYYGGMLTPFGQHMVPPHVLDLHHPRMPLPHEMAQEPVYVNAKQYHGILRRRESRAKAELEKKLIKVRKPYLHESRHQHALKRARASGGRFAKKSDADTSKGAGSGSEPLLSSAPDVAEWHKDRSLAEHQHSYSNGSGYGKQNSFQEPNYQAQSAQVGEGGSSGQ